MWNQRPIRIALIPMFATSSARHLRHAALFHAQLRVRCEREFPIPPRWKGRLRRHLFCPMISTEFPARTVLQLRGANHVRFRRGFRATNPRGSNHQQPGRERPPNRPWGQGPGSAGGVAHALAALRRHPFARRRMPRPQRRKRTRRLSATQTCCRRNRRGGRQRWSASDECYCRESAAMLEGRWSPWVHHPLHLPLSVVSRRFAGRPLDGAVMLCRR